MATVKPEDRVKPLEAEVARLKEVVEARVKPAEPWWDRIAGTFAGDEAYEDAVRLGRGWRDSFRPRPRT